MNDIQPTPGIFDINDLLLSYENQLSSINLKAKNLKKNIRAIKKVQASQKQFEMMIDACSGVSTEMRVSEE